MLKKLIFFFLIACFFTACKEEGCTDKNAINFDSFATEDDGSCVYCQDDLKDKGTLTFYVQEDRSSSEYFGQNVLEVKVTQTGKYQTDGSCEGENECLWKIEAKNITQKKMVQLTYFLRVNFSNFQSKSYTQATPVSINAGSTYTVDYVASSGFIGSGDFNACADFGLSSNTFSDLYSVTYQ